MNTVLAVEAGQSQPRAGIGSDRACARLPVRLSLFFTRGMSLEAWHKGGRLDRELMLYEALDSRLESISFVTYGGRAELTFADRVGSITILPNRWQLDSNLYSLIAPFLHVRAMRQATIFKTNQLNGAWCAAIAKCVFRKQLVVRCGFIWSDFYARLTPTGWKRRLARHVEQMVLKTADRIVVATEADRRHLVEQRGIPLSTIRVIPNYVDTEQFRPMPAVDKQPGLLCFVGNLGVNKNLPALLDAIKGLSGVRLALVGDGSMRPVLEETVRKERLPVEFLGTVPNDRLPTLLNRAQVFVFPSLYEGHPKVLLEAMACGLPVITTDAPGNRDVVVHQETGFLCGTSAGEIRAAIAGVMADASLCARLGARAREAIVTTCSVEQIVERELALLAELSTVHGKGSRNDRRT